MRNKIYISGCGGMLGEAFYRLFKDDYDLKCSDIDINEPWLTYCDIRDFKQYEDDVKSFNTDVLFHLGALTDLEYCELHPDEAYLTNTISVENAVFIANRLHIPILFISTAGIFDDSKEYYDDWDLPNPLGHYARSKYAGEIFVRDNAEHYIICRPGWMMGGGPIKDKKFINKIMKQIKSGRKELFIVNDKFGAPTYTYDLVRNVKLLLEQRLWGLYNIVCKGEAGRVDVAMEIISVMGYEKKIKIKEVSSEYFKEEYFVVRPKSERLVNKKLDLRGLNVMRHWKIALKEYIELFYDDWLK